MTNLLPTIPPPAPEKVVSPAEWLTARQALLAREKEHTRSHDALCEERRALPWVKVEKEYVFQAAEGPVTLRDLFAGRNQLVIQHFMLGPGWEEGCIGCSFMADHIPGALVHLEHHDVSFVTVARAPLDEIQRFHRRMGWPQRWVSSYGSDFNYDFHVSFTPEQLAQGQVFYNYQMQEGMDELHGMSVFVQAADGAIYHTYSSYGRGDELVMSTYNILELTPLGRNENGLNKTLVDWVKHHDKYDAPAEANSNCCGCTPEEAPVR